MGQGQMRDIETSQLFTSPKYKVVLIHLMWVIKLNSNLISFRVAHQRIIVHKLIYFLFVCFFCSCFCFCFVFKDQGNQDLSSAIDSLPVQQFALASVVSHRDMPFNAKCGQISLCCFLVRIISAQFVAIIAALS